MAKRSLLSERSSYIARFPAHMMHPFVTANTTTDNFKHSVLASHADTWCRSRGRKMLSPKRQWRPKYFG